MDTKHFFIPDGNTPPQYTYVVAEETDVLWDPETCIEVQPKPSKDHEYDFSLDEWVLSEEKSMSSLREKRNLELLRTDKYMLSDFPITEEDRQDVVFYRMKLRKCTGTESKNLPECPKFCKK